MQPELGTDAITLASIRTICDYIVMSEYLQVIAFHRMSLLYLRIIELM